MPVFNIHHVTKYEYDRPVKESMNEIRIYPFVSDEQEMLHQEVNITDNPDILLINDYWGNCSGLFNLLSSHKHMVIESKLIIRTLRKDDLTHNMLSGFDSLKEEVAGNLKLIELSHLTEIELRERINEITTQIYTQGDAVADVVRKYF
jgi:archaellum biogenesis ATPase FlaH